MKLSTKIEDNVAELLVKIIDFTERRKQILTENVTHANTPGYVPRDLDVTGFADLMTRAVAEHMQSERLVLCDSATIKFGENGGFETAPIVDEQARKLHRMDSRRYLEQQIHKLAENLLHHKVAGELLRQKKEKTAYRRSG